MNSEYVYNIASLLIHNEIRIHRDEVLYVFKVFNWAGDNIFGTTYDKNRNMEYIPMTLYDVYSLLCGNVYTNANLVVNIYFGKEVLNKLRKLDGELID